MKGKKESSWEMVGNVWNVDLRNGIEKMTDIIGSIVTYAKTRKVQEVPYSDETTELINELVLEKDGVRYRLRMYSGKDMIMERI